MNEKKRQAVVASCHERLDRLTWFNEDEIYIILAQSNFDKGVVKHALKLSYSFHEVEEREAAYDD